jgi:hypothetical protein
VQAEIMRGLVVMTLVSRFEVFNYASEEAKERMLGIINL